MLCQRFLTLVLPWSGQARNLGTGWKLVYNGANGERAFVGAHKTTANRGDVRLAIFDVTKQ